jgi:hypothetical protein
MFKQILIIILIILLSYFVVKFIFTAYHRLYLSNEIVKYKMTEHDKNFLKMYSSDIKIGDIDNDFNLFFTDTSWSMKNNNYILFNNRYYIIEPGYYYYIKKDYQLFLNNKKTVIKLFDKNKLKKITK